MSSQHDTMMKPAVEGLLERAGSKFRLVRLASTRARQINGYFNSLGDGLGAMVPPQVQSVARKPLSIAFEEISADKIVPIEREPEPEIDPDEVALLDDDGDAGAEEETASAEESGEGSEPAS